MSRAKGRRIVRKYKEDFVDLKHCVCDEVERTGRFIPQKDLYGLYDCVKIDDRGVVSFIQITCNKPHAHKKYVDFAKKWATDTIHIMQYIWYDRKGWVIFNYTRDGKKQRFDRRK